MMKTPEYTLKVQRDYRKRLTDKGYKFFTRLVSPEVFDKLTKYYERLTKEK